MACPDRCDICERPLNSEEGHRTVVRRSERIARATIEAPGGEHYAFRSRSHAFFDEPVFVCVSCMDQQKRDDDLRKAYLRSATLWLAAVAALVVLISCIYAYLNPDAGPDLLQYIWHDPLARPKPEPWQPPPTYTPYKPPFGN